LRSSGKHKISGLKPSTFFQSVLSAGSLNALQVLARTAIVAGELEELSWMVANMPSRVSVGKRQMFMVIQVVGLPQKGES